MTAPTASAGPASEVPFRALSDLIRAHARQRPMAEALCDEGTRLSWSQLDRHMDRIAAHLQQQGLQPGEVVAIWAGTTVASACIFLGALRAGAAVAPLSPSVTMEEGQRMLQDAQARWVFADAHAPSPSRLEDWMAPEGSVPQPWTPQPEDPFNIIYSSGTTGTPKGIVQPHRMRWMHVRRGEAYGYGPDSRTLLSTPLYSNTTLVAFMPTLGWGGCVHLMGKFDAGHWLQTAERERITHTMLVPVQYRRLLDHPALDATDLRSMRMKFCTSAPFSAELKAEVLRRMPGGLVEFYGMTEGGGTCILEAHLHPDKLHTVGRPSPGHDIRLIDEEGVELPPSAIGEVVGRSPAMMSGYHRRPEATREAQWHNAQGQCYIRTGDVGRFDEDGFLVLMDRRKDMIISGGFNLYPSDLEALLRTHPAVADAAVVGVASRRWGETPVAWVVLQRRSEESSRQRGEGPLQGRVDGLGADPTTELLNWFNARCGRTQRLAGLAFIDELPRSAIGKVLKRELRERWAASNPEPIA